MNNSNSDSSSDNEWEDRGDVAWNEFDWERYLREQDKAIRCYADFYEKLIDRTDRIDVVAEKMGWDNAEIIEEEDPTEEALAEFDDSIEFEDTDGVYTLHKNPVYIATKGLFLGLNKEWTKLCAEGKSLPAPLAISYVTSLHQGEELAMHGIHALEFGDYAMAISLLKRALSCINSSMGLINADKAKLHPELSAYTPLAYPRLFDLREIWLRVINECRKELKRPIDEEN
jgi:hypothetical protein